MSQSNILSGGNIPRMKVPVEIPTSAVKTLRRRSRAVALVLDRAGLGGMTTHLPELEG